jgi:hypothetical protein
MLQALLTLSEIGPTLGSPHTSQVKGTKIRELRILVDEHTPQARAQAARLSGSVRTCLARSSTALTASREMWS